MPNISDEEYFNLIQIGYSVGFSDILYKGVSERFARDPDFADTFAEFAGDFYKSRSWSSLWKRILLECRQRAFREVLAKSRSLPLTNVRQWGKALQAINTQDDLRIESQFSDKVQSHLKELDDPDSKRHYAFSPGIYSKNTEFLIDISEKLEEEPANILFGLGNKEEKIARWGLDLFQTILRESGENGWPNANALFLAWQKMPKRDLPEHSMIIHLSNVIVKNINASSNSPTGSVRLSQLNPAHIENIYEAIDRCMYAIFELGQQPRKDPINFRITAEIVAKTFAAVEALRKSEQLP